MTDITELVQSEINDALAQLKQISEYPTPSTQYARVPRKYILALVEALEKAQQRISRLESRSVKLPKAMSIEGGAYCSAHAHYDSDGDYYDRTDVEEMLSAAGIKVEAE